MLKIKRENGKIYSPIREQWLVETSEELVRQEFICVLHNEFGYPLEVMVEEYRSDYTGRGTRSTRADIVIFKSVADKAKNYNAYIVVECKSEVVKIMLGDFYQATEYAAKTNAQFLILHNSKETSYYSVDFKKIPNKDDAFKQITTIPKFDEIGDLRKVEEIKAKTKVFTRKDFTELLFACHNIIRNNYKLSPEAAFDEISKILFIKINHERLQQGKSIFTLERYLENKSAIEKADAIRHQTNTIPYMQTLFNDTKEHYQEARLFADNEKINIRENSFEQILKKLEIYNLSDTSDDVKGIAFEEFLGKTFRGELGQFFTPRTIVDFMTEILDPEEGELICDPTCGSGGFLIKSFEYIRNKIEQNINEEKERLRSIIEGSNFDELLDNEQIAIQGHIDRMITLLNKELDHMVESSRMYQLSHSCIFGTDANPRMARVSKMNMIMHGDGHGGVHHHDGLLNINGIYEERFDVILTNPPFGARVDRDLKVTDQEIVDAGDFGETHYKNKDGTNKAILKIFDTGSMSALTEVLFMERCLRLLKKGGRMGIVLPEGVLNTSNLRKVREYFEGKAKLILITSIPQDVFIAAGATVKPSLVFMKRFTEDEEKLYAETKERAEKEIEMEFYNEELVALRGESALENTDKKRQRQIGKRIEEIGNEIIEKAKPLIKKYFDYEIPIAKVDKAGITSTGAICENELDFVRNEFRGYAKSQALWNSKLPSFTYNISSNGDVVKIVDDAEVMLT